MEKKINVSQNPYKIKGKRLQGYSTFIVGFYGNVLRGEFSFFFFLFLKSSLTYEMVYLRVIRELQISVLCTLLLWPLISSTYVDREKRGDQYNIESV